MLEPNEASNDPAFALQPIAAQAPGAPTMLSRIRTLPAQPRKSNQRRADGVLSAPTNVPSLSIAASAESNGVSQPTVARFCPATRCRG